MTEIRRSTSIQMAPPTKRQGWALLLGRLLVISGLLAGWLVAAPLIHSTVAAANPPWLAQTDQQAAEPITETAATLDDDGDDIHVPRDDEQSEEKVDPLPEWITRGTYSDDEGNEFLVVASTEEVSLPTAKRRLRQEIVEQLSRKIDEYLIPGASRVIRISDERIEQTWLPGHRYTEVLVTKLPVDIAVEVGTDVQKAYRCYSMLKLDDEFYAWANESWNHQLVRSRVFQTGVVGLAVIGLLSIVFGAFHLNHRTRGFYGGRLQLVSLAMLLILAAVVASVSNLFDWL